VYAGPHGLTDWRPPLPGNWREESGHIVTETPGALLHGEFELPARAPIELEISWRRKADFVVAFGVSDEAESVKQAFRLEALGSNLILMRELRNKADVALVQAIPPAAGRIRLQVLLDQEDGRCLVLSEQGGKLAEPTVPSGDSRTLPGLRIINRSGDLHLQQVRIARMRRTPNSGALNVVQLRLIGAAGRNGRGPRRENVADLGGLFR
jgi:hypothetical protein